MALEDTRTNLARLRILLCGASVAFALFLTGLILAFLWRDDAAQAIGALATIASGGGLLFFYVERNAAERTHDGAKAALWRDCAPIREFDPAGQGLPEEAVQILAR